MRDSLTRWPSSRDPATPLADVGQAFRLWNFAGNFAGW
jgi:hypothetical protein